MANFFDQFDETPNNPPAKSGNFFDQFDEPPRSVAQTVLDADREFAGAVVRGVGQTAATTLRGMGAGVESGPAGEGRALQTAIEAIQQGGQDPSQAIETARTFGPRFQDVTEQPLYQAGERVDQYFKEQFPDAGTLNPTVRDIGTAGGSLVANIGLGLTPGVGPAALIGSGTFQGRGEAAERAVKAGATPEQQVQAAQLGAGPGLTDFVDLALTRSGVGGAGASRVRRALTRLAEGGLIEGTQEGLQQFLQNAIARGVYKPDQDLSEEVLYNAFLGAVIGGGAKMALGGGPQPAPPPSAASIDQLASDMASGVPQPPPGGVPVAPTPSEAVPPAAGPEEFGLGPTPTAPPVNVPISGEPDAGVSVSVGAPAPVEGPTLFPTRPAAVPPSHVDPQVTSFLAKNAPPLQVPGAQKEVVGPIGVSQTTEPRLAANVNPPPTLTWEIFNSQFPNEVFTTDAQGQTLAAVMEDRGGYVPSFYRLIGGGRSMERAYEGPVFKTPEVAKEYAEAVVQSGRFDNSVDTKPFLDRDRMESEARTRRAGFTSIEGARPAREEVATTPGANLGRLAALLGPKLYGSPKDLTSVSVKEMVQNSFDALKTMLERGQIQRGKIDIVLDPETRTLTIADNGSGMTPEVLGKQFLEIAGTQKESSRASGGLGIAKMLFLFGNQNLEVLTLRDNKVSLLQTTGKQLFAALENPASAPKITVKVPDRQTRNLFPEGHGTIVRVKVPETYTDPTTGENAEIPFNYYSPRTYPVLQNSPLFDNIEVTFNGEPVANMGSNFPVQDYTQFANVNFDWGTARVYVSKAQGDQSPYSANAHVLSNGLWQFSFGLKKNPNESYGENIKRKFYIDVSPQVRPEDAGYPFDLNRQQFSPQARKDFERIFNYISVVYQEADFANDVKNFGDIEVFTMGPDGVTKSQRVTLEPELPQRTTALTGISEGDEVSVVDGKLVVNGRTVPELKPEDIEQFKVDVSNLKIPQESIDSDSVILHDNVDVKISDVQTVSISELAREKFGDRFDNFVFQMGQAFIELRNTVADMSTSLTPPRVDRKGNPILFADERPWAGLRNEGIGISFDPEYRGVSIRIPFSASFLNIAVPEFTDTLRASVGMVGTMVHELAHHNVRSHDAAFPAEMQRIIIHLDTHPSFDFHSFKQRVVDIVATHEDVFQYVNGVLTSGTFPVQSRGKRFSDTSAEQAGDGSNTRDVGADGLRAERPLVVHRGTETSAAIARTPFGRKELSIRVSRGGQSPQAQLRNDQRLLDSAASGGSGARGPGPDAVFRQPENEPIRANVEKLFQGIGGPPTGITTAASHADRMNRWYKWMAGLDQLVKANPYFLPLRNYFSSIQQMHNEESRIQDAALRIAKRWRSLGDEGERLAAMIDEIANMRYRTADEVRRGIERQPTADELRALISKHKLSEEGIKVFDQIRKIFDAFLELIKANAIDAAQRIVKDPNRLAQKLDEIQAHIDSLRARPYFPLMRFGRHYVMKKDAAGNVIHFETFERAGYRSAESRQKEAWERLKATAKPGEVVMDPGLLPEAASSFNGLPSPLLEVIKNELALTPDQLAALEQIQLMQSSALNFKRMMKSNYVPGYSLDFKRSFARYFFHGARYYARTKYGNGLRSNIAAARAAARTGMSQVKANMIGDYMEDHLQNTILDAKGDFGILKAGIFIWALGYMPAAATMNLLQTPTVTFAHLAGKFGGLGLGNKRAGQAIIKAAVDVRNYYRRESYDSMSGFQFEALAYGIKTGRVSETQAPELAGLSAGQGLLEGIGGNSVQRGWTAFLEKGAFMFEMAEQFNRRVAFRAALDLAMKYPNAKAVREAKQLYKAEYEALQQAASGRRAYTPAEAAAITTAVHTVDQTQFIYARYARPRFMRGRTAGTLFVFKKYLQSMLFWLGQNKSDAMPQYLLIMALLGGLGGAPGYEDLRDLLRAFSKWYFGKDFNLDKKTRELVLSLANDKIDPDLVLHGLARAGFGVPALLDLMGSWVTGQPGRGLTTNIASDPNNPQGRGQNVAFPVLDRHRALSMGPLLGFSPGKLLLPQNDRDLDHTMNEEIQKAAGAVYGTGFNIFKALKAVQEGKGDDFKTYERAVPRALGALSKAYRAYTEGRERGRGGINSAPTIVPYDVRDPEQMMEVIFMAMGYQPLRQQARWDNIIAKVDAEKYWDGRRNGLLQQYFEASFGQNEKEIDKVTKAIQDFNGELPDFARGQAITGDILRNSMQQRARTRQQRELGVPQQRRNFGISQEIDRLYREGAVDVRPVR